MLDTIFALSTGNVRSGVAVIRVSGPNSYKICELFTGPLPSERRAVHRPLVSPSDGSVLDHGLVIRFSKGRSFTGEDSVEFQIHGSRATIRAVLFAIGDTGLARMADAGEFTRRALENGRMDLSQVEALGDLIDAETETQRRQALRVLDGALGEEVRRWRESLIWMLAQVAVSIDFSDEDLPPDILSGIADRGRSLLVDFSEHLRNAQVARIIREGFYVAIIGKPNVGKSTLLNQLAGREIAITSEIAGTTRDVLEVTLEVDGHAVVFLDTAGLRDADSEIEVLGVERARQVAEDADLRLFLVQDPGETIELGIDVRPNDIVLGAKCDLVSTFDGKAISGRTGQGVDDLLGLISEQVASYNGDSILIIGARQRLALTEARSQLVKVLEWLPAAEVDIELVSEHLKLAVDALDSLLGKVGIEDVLGEVFSRFCLGK